MMQLELRETTRPKGKCEPSTTRRVFELSKRHLPTIAILMAVLVAVGFKAAYSHGIEGQESLARSMKSSGQHEGELALVEAVYRDHEKGIATYKDQELAEQLRKTQSATGTKGKDQESLWLSSVKDEGSSVSIQGVALSSNAVQTLISDLETTGHFKNIEVRETYQEDKGNSQAFQFQLTCEFQLSRS